MNKNLFRCSAVYTSQHIMVYKDGEYRRAIISSKINEQVLVGDYLTCEKIYDDLYVNSIEPRKNSVQRLQAGKPQGLSANVDIVFIVTSANQDFNIARLERYYIIAKESNAKICFILSKIDLTDMAEELSQMIKERFQDCEIIKTSIYNEENNLYDYWNENETAVFIGSSGVGKSSLINFLLEDEIIKTKSIREEDSHGKHTTTARHMYVLQNGRIVIDTPGLRSVGISAEANTIDELFPEIKELEINCKFKDCTHKSEPGCAIKKALEDDELDYERYLRYLKLVGKEEINQQMHKGRDYQKKQISKAIKASEKNKRRNK